MKTTYNESGFTLIEILIGMVTITVALLAVTNLTVGVMNGTSYSNRLTTAITLGQDRLEYIKRVGYAKAITLAVTENYGDISNYSGFKRVTEVKDNLLPMRTIKVSVYWFSRVTDKGLKEYSIDLTTILSE